MTRMDELMKEMEDLKKVCDETRRVANYKINDGDIVEVLSNPKEYNINKIEFYKATNVDESKEITLQLTFENNEIMFVSAQVSWCHA